MKLFLFLITVVISFSCKNHVAQNPNVLFISIDDLRPQLGCYGLDYMNTPNLDKLAGEGTLFTNHFAQVPTCGASRYSMLTGMYPSHPRHLSNNAIVQEISNKAGLNNPETFIHHLKLNGYYTVGIGKISHSADGYVYDYNDPVSDKRELPQSWDSIYFDSGDWGTGWNAFFGYAGGKSRQSLNKEVKPYERSGHRDTDYPDGLTANLAIKTLRQLKHQKKPFFMGVGFFKPHLPFNAPKKYWDLYDQEDLPLSPNPETPKNVSAEALNSSNEFNHGYLLSDEHPAADKRISDAYARKLRHGYFASVSYVDAQIGRVLAELEQLSLTENTIVVVWGDHGWHLGDHSIWGKHTLFERALKSTLIFKVPGKKSTANIARGIVESVDIYPTLCDLCNIAAPENLDGISLSPMLNNHTEKIKTEAHGFWNNGTTVRTENYRLMRLSGSKDKFELFDHSTDPNETTNIAAERPEVVAKLEGLLKELNNE